MSRIVAWALVFALVNVISVCPLLTLRPAQAHSCCPRPPLPCSDSTSNRCLYVLFEKSKAERGFVPWTLAHAAVLPTEHIAAPNRDPLPDCGESPVSDASNSYLLFRVLRI